MSAVLFRKNSLIKNPEEMFLRGKKHLRRSSFIQTLLSAAGILRLAQGLPHQALSFEKESRAFTAGQESPPVEDSPCPEDHIQ
jgi:hypothetical protein